MMHLSNVVNVDAMESGKAFVNVSTGEASKACRK
jgi:hypothetical protein